MSQPRVKGQVITGLIFLFLAVVGVVATLAFLFVGLFATDSDVPVDGRPHVVSFDDEHPDERMIFVEEGGDASCEVIDEDGQPITLHPVNASVTRSINGADRVATATFTPRGHFVEVTCTGSDRLDAQVGLSPTTGSRLVLLVGGFGLSALLGVAGLILLVVALVRKLSAPRP